MTHHRLVRLGTRIQEKRLGGHVSHLAKFRREIRMRERRRRQRRRGRRRRRRRPGREREQGNRRPRRFGRRRAPPEPPGERRRGRRSSSLPPFLNRERNAEFWEGFLGGLEEREREANWKWWCRRSGAFGYISKNGLRRRNAESCPKWPLRQPRARFCFTVSFGLPARTARLLTGCRVFCLCVVGMSSSCCQRLCVSVAGSTPIYLFILKNFLSQK